MFPYICIGVDVIVGFPGESDEDFNETYNFIKISLLFIRVAPIRFRYDTIRYF